MRNRLKINSIETSELNCNKNKDNVKKLHYFIVNTIEERDSIICNCRENGLIVFVINEGYSQYQLRAEDSNLCNNLNWYKISAGDIIEDNNNLLIFENLNLLDQYVNSDKAKVGQVLYCKDESIYYNISSENTYIPLTKLTVTIDNNKYLVTKKTSNTNQKQIEEGDMIFNVFTTDSSINTVLIYQSGNPSLIESWLKIGNDFEEL